MNEAITYIRVKMNGKWTNLGIVAEEDEIKEHFGFVEDLLKQKERADELDYKLQIAKEKVEKAKKEERRALHDESYYREDVRKHKQRADAAESKLNKLREQLDHDAKEAFGEGYTIDWKIYNSLIEFMDDLERGEEQ